MSDTHEVTPARRRWIAATVGSGVLLATIDTTIVNIAIPTIRADFETSFQAVQWVPLAYLLTIATLTLGTGRLGDILGKKRIYTTGFAIFTIGSALCALSPSIGWLIGMRVVQAIGGVMILSLGAAIMTEAYPRSQRGRALGFIGTFVSIGVMAGPTLGGVLLSTFDWPSIFLVNVPIGIIGVTLAIRHVPSTPPAPGQGFDLPGTVLLSGALFCFSFSITRSQEVGFTQPTNLLLFGAAIVLAAAWVAAERRASSPMLRLDFFRDPMLTVSVITGFLIFTLISPAFFLLPFYLEGVLELPIRTVGLLLAVPPVATGFVAPLAGALSDRIGVRKITLAGLAIFGIGIASIQLLTETTEPWQFALIAFPIGLGTGTFQSPNNSAIMGSMPKQYVGAGAGILSITRLLGQVTGLSILGTLWAARVVSRTGDPAFASNASAAPGVDQVAALREVYLWALIAVGVAIAIGFWGMRREQTLEPSA